MHVTTAIGTWNRCELLRLTLARLTRITVPAGTTWEVLVVNNNCTDETDRVLADFQTRLPLRRVFEAEAGVSRARNAAIAAASGQYLLFIDDDVLVDESWLVEFATAAQAFPEAAVIGGVIEPWFPEVPDPALVEVFPRLAAGFCGLDHVREAGPLRDDLFVWTANVACRTAAIRGLRFDPLLGPRTSSTVGGDDIDFVRQVRATGGTVVWWPAMKVRHYVDPSRMTLDYLLRHQDGDGVMRVLMAPQQPPMPLVMGVPRWLLRRYAEVRARHWVSHLTPSTGRPGPPLLSGSPAAPGASRRVRSLTWRREQALLRGMIRGYRQLKDGGPRHTTGSRSLAKA